MEAYYLGSKIDYCSNINDIIHLKFAERYCDIFYTFDKDFQKLINHTELKIEVL